MNRKVLIGSLAAAGAVLCLLPLFPVLLFGSLMGGAASSGCMGEDIEANYTGPGIAGLSPAQMKNAAAVVARGRQMGIPERGIIVALATASQESRFRNYANDGAGGDLGPDQQGIARSLKLPHDAVGTDHGSVGIFQQQWPWWGSLQDLMNPATSAAKFYQALQKVSGWQSLPLTVAAQRVQRSAYPSAYADDEVLARQLLAKITPQSTSGDDDSVTAVSDTGPAASGSPAPSGAAPGSPPSAGTPADGEVFAAGGSQPLDSACADQLQQVSAAAVAGGVIFPLPAGSGYRDNDNYGGTGSHWANIHTGDDYSVACGTPVLAATGGRIIVRTDQSWAGTWLVEVQTAPGALTTWYAHMQKLDVANAQTVKVGQQIGEVGDRGNATGCHLHFEVHPRGGGYNQDQVDPVPWMKAHVGHKLPGGSQ